MGELERKDASEQPGETCVAAQLAKNRVSEELQKPVCKSHASGEKRVGEEIPPSFRCVFREQESVGIGTVEVYGVAVSVEARTDARRGGKNEGRDAKDQR